MSDGPEDFPFGDFPEDELLEIDCMVDPQSSVPSSTDVITDAQRSRSERNRQKALALKKARLTARPYPEIKTNAFHPMDGNPVDKKGASETKLVDTKAGFFIEEDTRPDLDEVEIERSLAPYIEPDRQSCLECGKELVDSFLLKTFGHEVCDKCKETEKDGKHELITRTDIKNEFLLKDFDIDKREPILQFILRKNPHNPRWGDMKLYLRLQVEKRALEVWGTEDALEAEHELRETKRDKAKSNKFAKKLKVLRMQVRGSLYKRDVGIVSAHEHEYGDETYNEEEDVYTQTCKTCSFKNTYEKM